MMRSNRVRALAIPKGLRRAAQDWRPSAYLGSTGQRIINRNAVVAIPFSSGARVTLATTSLGLFSTSPY